VVTQDVNEKMCGTWEEEKRKLWRNRARTLFEGKNLVYSNERGEKPLPRLSGCHTWGRKIGGRKKRSADGTSTTSL
jgi:hypothetical protein